MLKKNRCPLGRACPPKDVVKYNKFTKTKLYKVQKKRNVVQKGLKNYRISSILTLARTGNVSNPKKVPKL